MTSFLLVILAIVVLFFLVFLFTKLVFGWGYKKYLKSVFKIDLFD